MANISAIWQQAAHTTYHLSSPSCSTRAMLKRPSLNKRMSENVWKVKLCITCREEKPTLVFSLNSYKNKIPAVNSPKTPYSDRELLHTV